MNKPTVTVYELHLIRTIRSLVFALRSDAPNDELERLCRNAEQSVDDLYVSKDRIPPSYRKGRGYTQLSPEELFAIKNDTRSDEEIQEQYKVSIACIHKVKDK